MLLFQIVVTSFFIVGTGLGWYFARGCAHAEERFSARLEWWKQLLAYRRTAITGSMQEQLRAEGGHSLFFFKQSIAAFAGALFSVSIYYFRPEQGFFFPVFTHPQYLLIYFFCFFNAAFFAVISTALVCRLYGHKVF